MESTLSQDAVASGVNARYLENLYLWLAAYTRCSQPPMRSRLTLAAFSIYAFNISSRGSGR